MCASGDRDSTWSLSGRKQVYGSLGQRSLTRLRELARRMEADGDSMVYSAKTVEPEIAYVIWIMRKRKACRTDLLLRSPPLQSSATNSRLLTSTPSGPRCSQFEPFTGAYSAPRVTDERLWGRAARTGVPRLEESGALSFLRTISSASLRGGTGPIDALRCVARPTQLIGNTLLTGKANRVIVIGRLSAAYGFGRAFPWLPRVAAL
jgi:hypothetical protein